MFDGQIDPFESSDHFICHDFFEFLHDAVHGDIHDTKLNEKSI
jgi:hypothetical protein